MQQGEVDTRTKLYNERIGKLRKKLQAQSDELEEYEKELKKARARKASADATIQSAMQENNLIIKAQA
jgi:chromosome segregation ATPase